MGDQSVTAKQAEEALIAFDDWLNEPPSREVPEHAEAHRYRFDAYRRWSVAAGVLQRFIHEHADAAPQPLAPQPSGTDHA